MSISRVALAFGAIALFLVPMLHCDSSQRQSPESAPAAAPVPPPEPAPATPAAEPSAAADAPDDPSDPNREAKAAIALARKHYEAAKDPIDLDVYRVEYTLLLRTELEKLGYKKSALNRMTLDKLTERARKKGLMD